MATQTLTAMFDNYESAADAVRRLEATGVAHGEISIVSNDETHRQSHDNRAGEDATASGTGTGASLGTILGGGAGLLAGLGMLAIPGLGPVVAAGWLASTLVGAGVGAAAGGVVGALTGAGVSHEHATAYAEGIRRGGTLVSARVDDPMVARASEILDREGTVDMNEREATWRGEGWTAAPPVAAPSFTSAADAADERVARAEDRLGAGPGLEDAERLDGPALSPGQAGEAYAGDRNSTRGRVRSYPLS